MSDQVRVVCTDRGTHPSRELAVILLRGNETREALGPVLGVGAAERLDAFDRVQAPTVRRTRRGDVVPSAPAEVAQDNGGPLPGLRAPTWRLRCPTCGRDVQRSGDRMRRLVERLADAGVPTVDISALPANLD